MNFTIFSEEELSQVNQSGNSCVLNDMDWARNYLNYEGILDNTSARGTWTLSALGEKIVISDQLAGMIIAKWIRILAARRENKPIPEINLEPFYQYLQGTSVVNEPYTKAEFLSEVYMTEDKYIIFWFPFCGARKFNTARRARCGKDVCSKTFGIFDNG